MAKRKKRTKHLSANHRKAISRGLRRYHKRQREESVPKGFKTGRREVEPMLNHAAVIIARDHGVDAKVDREINADNSVDWELRIALPRGANIKDILIDLAQILKGVPNTWIGIGVRFQSDSRLDKDVQRKVEYERFQTSLQVHAHYQRNTDRKIQTNVLGIQKITESMKKNRRRKPHEIFVRIHWNLEGRKPK